MQLNNKIANEAVLYEAEIRNIIHKYLGRFLVLPIIL